MGGYDYGSVMAKHGADELNGRAVVRDPGNRLRLRVARLRSVCLP
jgi:hypothetical protein